MTAEQFKEKYLCNDDLIKKYQFVYLLINDIININNAEELIIKYGFTVKRVTECFPKDRFYSEIFSNNKLVGFIDLQGFPHIIFEPRKRKLIIVSKIMNDELIIKPINGIHRILDWHNVKNKMHCLAGGQTILHLAPIVLTEEIIKEYIKRLQLEPLMSYVTNRTN